VPPTPTADDHGNRYLDATAITVDGTTFGTLERVGDEDWFSFSTKANWVYSITALPGSLTDPFLRLIAQDGALRVQTDEDAGEGEISLIKWGAPTASTHYISVSAGDEGLTGNYSLTISGRRDDHGEGSGSASIAPIGTAIQGELEAIGDDDWFSFLASDGSSYRITTGLGTLTDSYLGLFGTDGTTRLRTDDDGGDGQASSIEWVAPESGTYYVNVRAPGSDLTGTYSLSIASEGDDHSDTPGAATVLTLQETSLAVSGVAAGKLEVHGDSDWFTFSAQAGWVYRVAVSLENLTESRLTAYDTDGITRLRIDDGIGEASNIEWIAPADGNYFLSVGAPQGDVTGTYSLTINAESDGYGNRVTGALPDEHINFYSGATSVPIGVGVANTVTLAGDLERADDRDWFSFTAQAGWVYRIAADLGSLYDSHISLYNIDGETRLMFKEGFGPTRMEWTAPASGDYFVMMRSRVSTQAGTYTLTIAGEPDDHAGDANNATAVPIGTSVANTVTLAGDLERADDRDWFSFTAQAGWVYRIAADLGSLSDSHISLYNIDGETRLMFKEGFGPTRMEWTAPASGTYFVMMRSRVSTQAGTYTLTIAGEPDDHAGDASNATAVPIGTGVANTVTMPGDLERADDRDWFSFRAQEGWVYRIAADLGSLYDSHISLYNIDGETRLMFDEGFGPSRMEWTAPASGDYFVMMRSRVSTQAGTYTLTIAGEPDDHAGDANWATWVSSNSPIVGDMEVNGDEDWFSFGAQAGVTYDFAVDIVSLANSSVMLWDTDGITRLTFNENYGSSLIEEWTAPTAGVYFLNVRSVLHDQAGGYTLTITGDFAVELIAPVPVPRPIKLIDGVSSDNRPAGAFGSNTITVTIPESRGPIVVSADPVDLVPAGIDDRLELRVTGPSGQVQTAILYDNDAYGAAVGEQWVVSRLINFEAGLNKIEVTLVNVYDPPGSNSSSPALYLIVLEVGAEAPESQP
jgi:hypothetical protein